MNERIYTVAESFTLTAAVRDLVQIEWAANKPGEIHRIRFRMNTTTEAMLRYRIRRITDTVTNDVAEAVIVAGDAAFSGNLAVNETTQLVTGAATVVDDMFNAIEPLDYFPPPEHRVQGAAGDAIVLSLDTAPEAVTCSLTMWFSEVG